MSQWVALRNLAAQKVCTIDGGSGSGAAVPTVNRKTASHGGPAKI
jgi:hypothetical protein